MEKKKHDPSIYPSIHPSLPPSQSQDRDAQFPDMQQREQTSKQASSTRRKTIKKKKKRSQRSVEILFVARLYVYHRDWRFFFDDLLFTWLIIYLLIYLLTYLLTEDFLFLTTYQSIYPSTHLPHKSLGISNQQSATITYEQSIRMRMHVSICRHRD